MLLGGLDIGTTGCKLSLYDEWGACKQNSYREYVSNRSDDAQEINAEAVWAAVQEVIREGAAYGNIDAIGVTSFGESFVLLDAEDRVLLPSMLYTDKRGNEECARFDAAEVEAGVVIRVTPGQSISLPNGQYHKFWGEEGTGMILLGEVSKVNDDRVDNRFYEEVGRFPDIDEDEPPLHLLGNEYPVACD